MPRETIPTAGSGTDSDLKPDFTYEELWAEIDKVYPVYEERLPGDIDYHDMMKRYRVGPNQANDRMNKLVELGQFKFVTVIQKGHHIRVIRKV